MSDGSPVSEDARGAAEAEDRLFPIQSYGFETGTCADGRQVVMGLLCPYVVAYFFDDAGRVAGGERRSWSDEAGAIAGAEPPYRGAFDGAFVALIDAQREAWQAELGFQQRTIHVREFADVDLGVCISRLPDFLEDQALEAVDDEDERRGLPEDRNAWWQSGSFIWWWGKDYYMNGDGEVEAT